MQPDLLGMLMNVGFAGWLPADHVFPEEDEGFSATLKAVRYPIAGAMVAIPARRFPRPVVGNGDRQHYYYLV